MAALTLLRKCFFKVCPWDTKLDVRHHPVPQSLRKVLEFGGQAGVAKSEAFLGRRVAAAWQAKGNRAVLVNCDASMNVTGLTRRLHEAMRVPFVASTKNLVDTSSLLPACDSSEQPYLIFDQFHKAGHQAYEELHQLGDMARETRKFKVLVLTDTPTDLAARGIFTHI
jgi:hypothetical protein